MNDNLSNVTPEQSKDNFNIWSLWWVIPLVLLYLGYTSIKNNLVIENLSSNSPLFEATTVSAVIYNNGPSKQYRYYVQKGNSEVEHCPGQFFIGEGERRKIEFRCNALTGYSGKFYFQTTTS